MAIAKTVLINLHAGYKLSTKQEGAGEFKPEPDPNDPIVKFGELLKLEEQTRETAELKAKEMERRAQQNPEAKARNKADTGTQVIDAEQKCRLEEVVKDLFASGFRITDAYWQHKRQFQGGVPTDILNGRVYRIVFMLNATDDDMFLDDKDVEELVADLLRETKYFVAPCVNVWDNPGGTQTINVGHNFRRQSTTPSRHVGERSLRYRLGEYAVEPIWRRKPYTSPPRVQL